MGASTRKKHISVVMGGPSAEHEVSLMSGREVLQNLDRNKYTARAVVINRERTYYCCDATESVPSAEQLAAPASAPIFDGPFTASASKPIWDATDIAFLALHGTFGEDGLFQGFLDTIGVPYTGSGVFASAVGMNKIATSRLFKEAGLTTPRSLVFGPSHPELTVDVLIEELGLPCFAKCPQSGSSRLMGRAQSREQLEALLQQLQQHAAEILVETALAGAEYSCPVLEYPNGAPAPLLPVLIRPVASAFFDYEAKYTTGASEEIVPAPCSSELARRIQHTALRAHQIVGCSGLSRTDIIVSNDSLYVLEINTLPGLTPASLAPKSFAAQGGTYAQLLDILIDVAAQKGPQPQLP